MRLIFPVFVLSLSLAGCATPGSPPIGSGPDLATIVAEIRANTQFICKFVPTSDSALRTLINTFTTTVPGVSIGWSIADAICNAVKAETAATGTSRTVRMPSRPVAPVVNGVVIKGTVG